MNLCFVSVDQEDLKIVSIWLINHFRLGRSTKSYLKKNNSEDIFRWAHCCIVLTGLDENSEFAKVQIWFQGQLKLMKEFKTTFDPLKDGKGILILGQEQDSYGGGFDKFQSFSGKISQFNIFKRLK